MNLRTALPLFAPFLLFALTVRALVPFGWMPMANDAGVTFRICPDSVSAPLAQADSQMGHRAKHDHDRSSTQDPCPFGAMTAHGGNLPDMPALAERIAEPPAPPQPLSTLAIRQLRWLGHALARGPPDFA